MTGKREPAARGPAGVPPGYVRLPSNRLPSVVRPAARGPARRRSRPPRPRPGRRRRSRGRPSGGRRRSATGCAARSAQISAAPPPPANGLSEGIVHRPPQPDPWRGSMRSTFPSSALRPVAFVVERFWPFEYGSPPPPPSPVPIQSMPSGPNWSWPPLWLDWRLCGDAQDAPARRRERGVRVSGIALELVDLDVAGLLGRRRAAGVVDVEAPAGRVIRRESHRQQPALAPGRHEALDVEEDAALSGVLQQRDGAALLDHEHAVQVAGRRGDVGRRREVAHLHQRGRLSGPGRDERERQRRGGQDSPHADIMRAARALRVRPGST